MSLIITILSILRHIKCISFSLFTSQHVMFDRICFNKSNFNGRNLKQHEQRFTKLCYNKSDCYGRNLKQHEQLYIQGSINTPIL